MIIKKLSNTLEKEIKKSLKKISKKNQLVLSSFLIGKDNTILKNHFKLAKKFKIKYNLIQFDNPPTFISFAKKIKEQSDNPQVKGIIINQPLPAQLSTDTIFNYIKLEKDIEGHRKKSQFYPPTSLSFLNLIKYALSNKKEIVNLKKDKDFFKNRLKNKNVVFINQGDEIGKIISKTLNEVKINFINIVSKIENLNEYLKEADLIIDITENDLINLFSLKPKAIFIKINPKIKIKKNPLPNTFYFKDTKILDDLYLFKNLIEVRQLQK